MNPRNLAEMLKEVGSNNQINAMSFSVDTLNQFKFFTQRVSTLNDSGRSLMIRTQYIVADSVMAEFESDALGDVQFIGQKVFEDQNEQAKLIYLLDEGDDDYKLFELTYDGKQLKLSEIDENMPNWTELVFEVRDHSQSR